MASCTAAVRLDVVGREVGAVLPQLLRSAPGGRPWAREATAGRRPSALRRRVGAAGAARRTGHSPGCPGSRRRGPRRAAPQRGRGAAAGRVRRGSLTSGGAGAAAGGARGRIRPGRRPPQARQPTDPSIGSTAGDSGIRTGRWWLGRRARRCAASSACGRRCRRRGRAVPAGRRAPREPSTRRVGRRHRGRRWAAGAGPGGLVGGGAPSAGPAVRRRRQEGRGCHRGRLEAVRSHTRPQRRRLSPTARRHPRSGGDQGHDRAGRRRPPRSSPDETDATPTCRSPRDPDPRARPMGMP